MVRRYTWMLCVITLCFLLLGWIGTPATAVPAIVAPISAPTFRQEGDDTEIIAPPGSQDADGEEEQGADGEGADGEGAEQEKTEEEGAAEGENEEGAEGEGEGENEEAETAPPTFKPETGSLSLLKLGLIVIIFLPWVGYVDSINRDNLQFGDKTGLQPEVWSPILVGSFLVGLLAVLLVPIFWAGFPVFVIAALAPPITYSLIRRGRVKSDESMAKAIENQRRSAGDEYILEELPQDEGADVSISTHGADSTEKQARLIRGRQSQEFPTVKDLIHDAQFKRTEQLVMDCSRDGARLRMLVDGVWHPGPPMEREVSDGVVVSLKSLAGLNPTDRRSEQRGSFDVKSEFGKAKIDLRSQGVATGERVFIHFIQAKKDIMRLEQLGMFPDMVQKLCESMNTQGITIISAPAGHGLTSTWQGAITSSDRLTRDIIGFYDVNETDTDIENIAPRPYDPSAGETSFESLKKALLTQPDAIIAPTVADSETMDLLVQQANEHERAIAIRSQASSAAEAFLRIYAQSTDRNAFLTAAKTITCQRLIRRLCEDCRVQVRVKPQMIQKLGGNPKKQGSLFNQFKLPPPAQRVDENGDPIEFPPCPTCGGAGYIGRIAVFELLQLDEQLRAFIRKQPQAAAIEAAAVKLGKTPLVNQAYKLVLLGVTSIAEVQRVFNPPKKKP